MVESTTSWLARVCRLSHGEAKGKVALARMLDATPVTAAAVTAGELSPSHVRVLARAWRAHPDRYVAHEAALVDAAAGLSVRHLRKVVEHWKQAQDYAAALDDANRLYDHRNLPRLGDLRGDGPHRRRRAPRGRRHHPGGVGGRRRRRHRPRRHPHQRRLDALVKVCRHYLDTAATPVSGGERPHIGVILDLASLEGRPGGAGSWTATG